MIYLKLGCGIAVMPSSEHDTASKLTMLSVTQISKIQKWKKLFSVNTFICPHFLLCQQRMPFLTASSFFFFFQ